MKAIKYETKYYYRVDKRGDSIDIIVNEEAPDVIKIERRNEVWKSWDDMIETHKKTIEAIEELRKIYNK